MSNKKLTILGIAAAVMMVLAVVTSKFTSRTATSQAAGAMLIQGLNTAGIHSIVLGHGDETVTLKKQDKTFVVTNKDNYPAMTAKINDLIASVLDIRTTELITGNAANHDELEVTEEKAQQVVRFLDDKDKLITGVIIGKRTETGGTCVRQLAADQAASDKVYLSDNATQLQSLAMDYIDKEIFKVTKDDIARIAVTSPQDAYTITADEDGAMTLQNVPEDKKVKTSIQKQVFTAVTNLQFEDVQKESDKTAELKFDRTYVCELKDSTVCTFQLAQKDDETYMKCSAEFTDTTQVIKEQKVESEEALKEKEAKLLAQEAAVEFAQKHIGWVYKISSYKADNMTKKLADLLEDKEKAPAEDKAAPSPDKKETPVNTEEKISPDETKQNTPPETEQDAPSEDKKASPPPVS
jgi:hypothetical protein